MKKSIPKEKPTYPDVLHDYSGEYPSEAALLFVKNFDCSKYGILQLAEFIEQLWHWPDWGYKLTGKRKFKLELHTGGWSGNEEIISALRENFLFWSVCWKKHIAGGHFYFKIPNF